MADSLHTSQSQEEELLCYWKDCLTPFPDHDSLSQHLSEDHIGWKKGEYCCEWTNCSRKGVKCHNRFALMMHLRIHTGEKPFECDIDGCGMNFGRMDALSRHKKAEHGLDSQLDTLKRTHTGTTSSSNTAPMTVTPALPSSSLQSTSPSTSLHQDTKAMSRVNVKKRKLAREEDHSDKHKRGKSDMILKPTSSDMDESEELDTYDITSPSVVANHSSTHTQHHHHQTQRVSSAGSTSTSSGMSPQQKYKIAKAKLQYILRENEMLNDEWSSLQRRLNRLQTERRVLLDALVSAEDDQDGDILSLDEDEDEDDVDDLAMKKYSVSHLPPMVEMTPTNHRHNGFIA